jgi:hypothetical protein
MVHFEFRPDFIAVDGVILERSRFSGGVKDLLPKKPLRERSLAQRLHRQGDRGVPFPAFTYNDERPDRNSTVRREFFGSGLGLIQ